MSIVKSYVMKGCSCGYYGCSRVLCYVWVCVPVVARKQGRPAEIVAVVGRRLLAGGGLT